MKPRLLDPSLAGTLVLPGDDGFDEARLGLERRHRPAPGRRGVPPARGEVAAAVGWAAARGLRVAAQSTGHNAGPLGPRADTRAAADRACAASDRPAARVARVEGGALWLDVWTPPPAHGLAALPGASPDVGVAGYTLGGGISWFARKFGLAANNLTAVELVTADGRLVRATTSTSPSCSGPCAAAAAASAW